MVSRVFSAGLDGINGYIVTVECLLSGGLPRLDVVGLPTGAVSEAGERVRAAAKSCSFDWPVSRLTVNLAPADTRKAGTAFDLPILLSILAAAGEINALPQDALFFGELSLSGELRPVRGALSMALAARSADFRAVYVPAANAQEASYADSLTVYPVRTLSELINHLSGRKQLVPCPPPPEPKPAEHRPRPRARAPGSASSSARPRSRPPRAAQCPALRLPRRFGQKKAPWPSGLPSDPAACSRMIELARCLSASGRRSAGPRRPRNAPSGRSARRGSFLLGGSACRRLGLTRTASPARRDHARAPRRAVPLRRAARVPARRARGAAAADGGRKADHRPGGRTGHLSGRFSAHRRHEPRPCGWYGTNRCTCAKERVQQYLRRLSGPLLDRIDLQITVQPVEYEALAARSRAQEESSETIRARVLAARQRQYDRQGEDVCNAAILALASRGVLSADRRGVCRFPPRLRAARSDRPRP